jgi:DNA repair protein RecO (recombination protein O)
MRQVLTRGIVLSRTDYGEADRIITLITPEQGKVRVMARGVRKLKSKLAGGIELFSTSDITYIPGRGEIHTLISSRLVKHYGYIVEDIDRVQLGYELIKVLNKATEDQPEEDYYDLLDQSFQLLDDREIDLLFVRLWFEAQLIRLSGHTPNLRTDTTDKKLTADGSYNFDFDAMSFAEHPAAAFTADHIKTLRLLFSTNHPRLLAAVQGMEQAVVDVAPLIRTMRTSYIRV